MEPMPYTINLAKNLWLARSQSKVGRPKTITLLNGQSFKLPPKFLSFITVV